MTEARFETVAALERCGLGEEFSTLPPYVTLSPPFTALDERLGEYHERMAMVMSENPDGIRIIASEPAMFGSNDDIAVDKVSIPIIGSGFPIHCGALVDAKSIGEVEATYTGLSWNPHVSRVDGLRLPEGEIKISEFQLLRYCTGGLKRVTAIYTAVSNVTRIEEQIS